MPIKGKLTVEEKYACQLLALAHSLTETADMAGLSLDELRRAMGHPLFEAELAQARERAYPVLEERLRAHLERVQEPALACMEGLLAAESEPVQFQAARDLLNRGPLAPAPKYRGREVPEQGATIHLDQQALQAILAGALNMGQHGLIAAFAALPSPLPSPHTMEPTHVNTPAVLSEPANPVLP